MKRIITLLALGLATISNAHAYNAEQDKRAYSVINGIVTDYNLNIPFLDRLLDRYANDYANGVYGERKIRNSSNWVTNDVKHAWIQGYTGQGVNVGIIDNFSSWSNHGKKVESIIQGDTFTYSMLGFTGIALTL